MAGMIFIQNALPLLIKRGGLALQEAWQLSGCLFYMGWTFTVTDDDSFYFYIPHSSERHPEIQHCHSGRLAQGENFFVLNERIGKIFDSY